MLKDGGTTPFWIRNLQMYTCGVISAGIGCAIKDGASLVDGGFFRGYDSKVFCIIGNIGAITNEYYWCCFVGLLGVGGIYISLVMKYLDNLHKSFASAFSIILVVVASLFLFENVQIGWFFMIGSATVCFAVLLYNSVNE
jgi:UDP-sugar transporter A1/2/3